MIAYVKDIDETTGRCGMVGTGSNIEFYTSIGMIEQEVEQAADGSFYLAGRVPAPPETRTVRTFSKFSLWVATREHPLTLDDGTSTTVWAAFEQFLRDADLWTGYNQLVDLVEDNAFFALMYPQAVEKFGADLVEQVLAAAVSGSRTVIVNNNPGGNNE